MEHFIQVKVIVKKDRYKEWAELQDKSIWIWEVFGDKSEYDYLEEDEYLVYQRFNDDIVREIVNKKEEER